MKKVILLLCSLLVSCGSSHKEAVVEYDYSDVSTHIDWYDSFVQEEDDYLVYYYSETCSHCNSIKQQVIRYYLSEKEPMYFVNTNLNSKFGPVKELSGINDIDSFYIFGTPFLLRVKEHMVSDYYPGTKKILEYLKQ